MSRYRFSIIIVSWNALHHLKVFLPSVAATSFSDLEIIIADNASTDGSDTWMREHYPDIRIVKLDKNYGYCGGNNRAARQANGEILIFLNNDVEVPSDWLSEIDGCFQENPKIGIVQPKLLAYKAKDTFEYAGAAGGFIDAFGYPFCRGRVFDTVEKDNKQYDDPKFIFWASGAAFAIRRELFFELNGFDEDFEFHMEEIDLCWRVQNKGYLIKYCPKSVVYHLGGGSLAMGSPRKIYYNFRNNLVMLFKNYTRKQLWTRLPIRFLLDFIAAARSLLLLNTQEYLAIMRSHAYFWGNLSLIRKKRRHCEQQRTVKSSPSTQIDINLVWEYYFRRRKTYSQLKESHPDKFPTHLI